ncbi:MAG: hypothetical protein OEM81_02955, partial [Acidimicrobiia bacterium]|nr:hypothetical protein [Acidimicrobiia bacterium]
MTSSERHRRTILLIDADEAFLKRTEPMLSEHRLYTARNISEAQALVADEAIEVALVGPTYA